MSRKTDKELRRLDAALQEAAPEEDPMDTYEKELAQKEKIKIYNADRTDTDPEEYSTELLKKRKKFPWLPALLLLAAVVWYLWQQGVIPW